VAAAADGRRNNGADDGGDARLSLSQVSALFRSAFPPGHARFSACSAAALTLEVTRRTPPPVALDAGQRAALWHCIWAAFEFEDGGGPAGGGGGSGEAAGRRLALNPFLPLLLRAASPERRPPLPERWYLLRLLSRLPMPPAPPPADAGADAADAAAASGGAGGLPPTDAARFRMPEHDLPPSAAVERIAREEEGFVPRAEAAAAVAAAALCERWAAAGTAARAWTSGGGGGGGGGGNPFLLWPWQRPQPEPLPPVPGELRWLYPPLPPEQQEEEEQQEGGGGRAARGGEGGERERQEAGGASPPPRGHHDHHHGFLWDGSMMAGGPGEDGEARAPPRQQGALRPAEVRELVSRALRGPLPPSQQRRALDALAAAASSAPSLVARLGVEPEHVPLLVAHAPALACGLLVGGGGGSGGAGLASGARGREYLVALTGGSGGGGSGGGGASGEGGGGGAAAAAVAAPPAPLLASMEVVLELGARLPRSLLRAYVARCLASCEQLAEGGGGGGGGGGGPGGGGGGGAGGGGAGGSGVAGDPGGQARLVRLVCVFLTSLVKSGALLGGERGSGGGRASGGGRGGRGGARGEGGEEDDDDDDDGQDGDEDNGDEEALLHQLRAFCVAFSRVREAAALFQLLSLASGGSGSGGSG